MDLSIFEYLRLQTAAKGFARLEAMAHDLGKPEELWGRILRHLAAWDTVREVGVNMFAATPTSNAFLDAGVASGPDFWIHLSSVDMRNLPRCLREHSYSDVGNPGKGNFEHANPKGLHLFTWLREEPAAFRAHTDHLDAFSQDRTGWLDIYPAHERLSADGETDRSLLVDIGAGLGRDALMFRRRLPNMAGAVIVQDLPEVIADASKALPPDSGLVLQAADSFKPQSVQSAEIYLLHHILHDWASEDCLRILENTKAAMRKNHSRLLIVKSIIALEKADTFSTVLNITIMSMVGSRERTESDWRGLIARAGMHIEAVYPSVRNADCVIEVDVK